MTAAGIVTIVEGDGEETALPILLHRIARHFLGRYDLAFPPGRVHGRGKLTMAGGIENIIERTVISAHGADRFLVLIDADDDCPAQLGPDLQRRAAEARPDKRISVVLANREYEAWFLAAAPSLAGRRGLSLDLAAPAEPEKPRGCKEWLSERRTDGKSYRPTVDQAALTAVFDLALARANAPSFDKLCREVERLLADC